MEEESLEFYKINEKQKFIFLDAEKTCIGKKKFTYRLSRAISKDLLDYIIKKDPESKLIFPFGEKYKFFSIDIPYKALVTGIIGDYEVKVTMKISSNFDIKSTLEDTFIYFCENA